MNPAHLHLVCTHLPAVGCFFSGFFLLVGILKGSEEVKRLSLWTLVLSALLGLPSYLTGNPALTELKPILAGNTEYAERHLEVAQLALAVAMVSGVVGLAGLLTFRGKRLLPGWFVMLTLLLTVATGLLMGWTSNLGGKVRHTEIREAAPGTGH
jgi:uncharacterized membrane protein